MIIIVLLGVTSLVIAVVDGIIRDVTSAACNRSFWQEYRL